MNSSLLRLYVYELQMQDTRPLHVWLLEHARRIGIPAGAAFRTSAGMAPGLPMTRNGREDEEVGPLVVVEFAVVDDDADRLLESLAAIPLYLPFSRQPTEWHRTVTA